jgi:hypothetical protein
MGATSDFSRRRLAAFFAARLKATRADTTDAERPGLEPTPAPATRAESHQEKSIATPVSRPSDAFDSEQTI